MADIGLTITASKITLNDLVKDYGEALPEDKMKRIAEYVGSEMKATLAHRIEEDVYKEYHPKVYPRRSEHSGYGTPLNDMEKNVELYPKSIPGKAEITLSEE